MTSLTAVAVELEEEPIPTICTCTTKCTEGSVSQVCAVCNEDFAKCTGKEVVPEPVCTCEAKCTEGSSCRTRKSSNRHGRSDFVSVVV